MVLTFNALDIMYTNVSTLSQLIHITHYTEIKNFRMQIYLLK